VPKENPATPDPPPAKRPVDPKFTAAVLFAAVAVIGGVFWFVLSHARTAEPDTHTARPVPTPAPAAPARPATPAAARPTVAIQDGKTLDFSSGKPVLKDSADEKAIIERSVREMNEAAAGVTFGPAAPPAAGQTKKPAP